VRDKKDRTRIVKRTGGKLMTAKLLKVYVAKTIYAGVNTEKWTGGKPVNCRFKGLVSVELFNNANRGKVHISFDESEPDQPIVGRAPKLAQFAKKNMRNPDFPYKKVVTCPHCQHALLGSASRGRLGGYYPAYHCNNHGHYFRVPKPEFDAVIENFVKSMVISPERIDELMRAVLTVWEGRQVQVKQDANFSAKRREELETQIRVIVDKMKLVSSETAIKYMEEDLVKLERQIENLKTKKEEQTAQEPINMPVVLTYVQYFMEHLYELLIHTCNPLTRAEYFGVMFDVVPTYQEIKDGTQNASLITGINELFRLAKLENVSLVRMKGLEPSRLAALAPKASVSTIPPHPHGLSKDLISRAAKKAQGGVAVGFGFNELG
jgi:hypothetical protein